MAKKKTSGKATTKRMIGSKARPAKPGAWNDTARRVMGPAKKPAAVKKGTKSTVKLKIGLKGKNILSVSGANKAGVKAVAKAIKDQVKRDIASETSWKRCYAIRDAYLAHENVAKQKAKEHREIEEKLTHADLSKEVAKDLKAKSWDLKAAMREEKSSMRACVANLFEVMDQVEQGTLFEGSLKGHTDPAPAAPKEETPPPLYSGGSPSPTSPASAPTATPSPKTSGAPTTRPEPSTGPAPSTTPIAGGYELRAMPARTILGTIGPGKGRRELRDWAEGVLKAANITWTSYEQIMGNDNIIFSDNVAVVAIAELSNPKPKTAGEEAKTPLPEIKMPGPKKPQAVA